MPGAEVAQFGRARLSSLKDEVLQLQVFRKRALERTEEQLAEETHKSNQAAAQAACGAAWQEERAALEQMAMEQASKCAANQDKLACLKGHLVQLDEQRMSAVSERDTLAARLQQCQQDLASHVSLLAESQRAVQELSGRARAAEGQLAELAGREQALARQLNEQRRQTEAALLCQERRGNALELDGLLQRLQGVCADDRPQ
ncbi:hypothetical protein WJX72_003995 [[Myrmecia] bisecta]|uniref:Uncharacterized protein n=1 Tax=[Myrmecia] bisecta TaxID=41462 RepID=A0AAW1R6I3_9CHLO